MHDAVAVDVEESGEQVVGETPDPGGGEGTGDELGGEGGGTDVLEDELDGHLGGVVEETEEGDDVGVGGEGLEGGDLAEDGGTEPDHRALFLVKGFDGDHVGGVGAVGAFEDGPVAAFADDFFGFVEFGVVLAGGEGDDEHGRERGKGKEAKGKSLDEVPGMNPGVRKTCKIYL